MLIMIVTVSPLLAQEYHINDPCGFPDTTSLEFNIAASGNWGYGYDTLLLNLSVWKKSPFVILDSVGATVQGRAMYVLTIQDTTADTLHQRQRIWIHARTHPSEVQGTWVTNELIKSLLDSSVLAQTMRSRYIFNIMPMYNPDGVELGNARENANGIDIESNWNSSSPQKEVLVLKAQFEKHMSAPNPMKIMLNMHSAFSCTRYFVYHAEGGTSTAYSNLEQKFINGVRSNFPGGIEPYNYFVSWVNAPATQYPESWCWSNYKEKIMALTYEDGNCESASNFDSTAKAILKGIDKYLYDTTSLTAVLATNTIPGEYLLEQNYPNPFNPSTTIGYRMKFEAEVSIIVYDVLGREVSVLVDGVRPAGKHSVVFDASLLTSGVYFYQLRYGAYTEIKSMQYIQ